MRRTGGGYGDYWAYRAIGRWYVYRTIGRVLARAIAIIGGLWLLAEIGILLGPVIIAAGVEIWHHQLVQMFVHALTHVRGADSDQIVRQWLK